MVEIDDDELMSEYTINIIKDYNMRKLMGESSYFMVKENNDIEKNIKHIEQIYFDTYK